MTSRSVIVYALLFVIAMAGAYVSWTSEPEDERADGVVVIDAKPEDIASVRFESKEVVATLEVKKDELGQYVWVETERTIDKSKPVDPHAPHQGIDDDTTVTKTEGQTETKKSSFKAGKAGDQLIEDLAPFRVVRKLTVPEERLTEFGLDEPEGKLVITPAKGEPITLEIGDSGYGHRNVYLRDAKSGEIYVAKNSVVSPLERADTRLPEKQLIEFERSDVESVAITTGQSALQFVQRNREDASAARWTAPDANEPNESAGSWLDKVFRLRSSGYLAEAEKAETAENVFSVKFTPADGKAVVVTVSRGQDDKGEPAWFAKSDFTRGWVKLSAPIASDVAEDLATLITPAEAEPGQ